MVGRTNRSLRYVVIRVEGESGSGGNPHYRCVPLSGEWGRSQGGPLSRLARRSVQVARVHALQFRQARTKSQSAWERGEDGPGLLESVVTASDARRRR